MIETCSLTSHHLRFRASRLYLNFCRGSRSGLRQLMSSLTSSLTQPLRM